MQNHWSIDQWPPSPAVLAKSPTRVHKTKSQKSKPTTKTVDRKPNSMRGGGREGGRQRCRTGASRKRAATATHLIGLWAKSCHSTTIPMTHPHDRRTADSGPSLLGLQLIAIELVKELSNFSRLTHRVRDRERERENGKWKAVQGNRKTSLALHSPSPSSPSPSSLPFPAGVRVAPAHGI